MKTSSASLGHKDDKRGNPSHAGDQRGICYRTEIMTLSVFDWLDWDCIGHRRRRQESRRNEMALLLSAYAPEVEVTSALFQEESGKVSNLSKSMTSAKLLKSASGYLSERHSAKARFRAGRTVVHHEISCQKLLGSELPTNGLEASDGIQQGFVSQNRFQFGVHEGHHIARVLSQDPRRWRTSAEEQHDRAIYSRRPRFGWW